MRNKKYRIAIIGLDGANKTTSKLIGIKSQLHDFVSTIPPYTPPAWTSIVTGVNPAKHGIIDFLKIDPRNFKSKLTTSYDVRYPRISEFLDVYGLRSILINLPMSYPFDGFRFRDNTIIVSDWAAPRQEIYPKKIKEKYNEYLIDPPHSWEKHKNNSREYAKLVEEFTNTRLTLYYELLEKHSWDLYFLVFSETDWFSHIFPQILEGKDTHLVSPVFRKIKKFIHDARDIADITFIVSDHGFEIKRKIFYVNQALARSGFIEYNEFKASLIRLGRRMLPPKIAKILMKKGITQMSHASNSQRRKAFFASHNTWGVYTTENSIKEQVKRALNSFPEISKVVSTEEIYTGPYLHLLPDLFIIPKKGVELSAELKRRLVEPIYKGDHEIHGVFSTYGEHIKDSIKFERLPRVYDIVPTILHIFGLPIPNDMDGRVLMEIFEEDSEFAKRKPKYVDPSYYEKNQEDEKLKKAIKNLKLKGKL
ncbi:alkaline phosphatase family protein [Thermococcus barophilus]|uniref:Type I phosphodiesterase/nucleotide pyrophosphatase n=1 Tax=Thermococcus barophilus (strain DSM 11836 / MP) TaxID=391623 RepID=F0LLW7_THEBM|nr:alkaline phosphatase family protein [Thermococcus barophilus]ADT85066.1 type I phosphodiesterase/nucleotide pyrophosphatase [Thermococcus barophilus MP]